MQMQLCFRTGLGVFCCLNSEQG
uniref:Uncharacterized protein n=1 Tax=Arundo donax TaxID=35708 RepID=A0A0A9FPU4_ARUDO